MLVQSRTRDGEIRDGNSCANKIGNAKILTLEIEWRRQQKGIMLTQPPCCNLHFSSCALNQSPPTWNGFAAIRRLEALSAGAVFLFETLRKAAGK